MDRNYGEGAQSGLNSPPYLFLQIYTNWVHPYVGLGLVIK